MKLQSLMNCNEMKVQSMCPFKEFVGSKYTPVQSMRRFRACIGSEYAPVQSMHRFKVSIGLEYASVQSMHRFRVCFCSKHTSVQSILPKEYVSLEGSLHYRRRTYAIKHTKKYDLPTRVYQSDSEEVSLFSESFSGSDSQLDDSSRSFLAGFKFSRSFST